MPITDSKLYTVRTLFLRHKIKSGSPLFHPYGASVHINQKSELHLI